MRLFATIESSLADAAIAPRAEVRQDGAVRDEIGAAEFRQIRWVTDPLGDRSAGCLPALVSAGATVAASIAQAKAPSI